MLDGLAVVGPALDPFVAHCNTNTVSGTSKASSFISTDLTVHMEWVGAHGLCANNVGLDGIDLLVDTVGIVM